jgi:hypothetical protein
LLGSGGGVSQYESQPAYQSGLTPGQAQRLTPDVALVGDPGTGVTVVHNGRTYVVGGTSVGAPQWAALIAIADQGRAAAGAGPLGGASQVLPAIYALSQSDFHDTTKGNNGSAAKAGFDLVTGRGTPVANRLISDLVSIGSGSEKTGPRKAASNPAPVTNPPTARPLVIVASSTSDRPGLLANVGAIPATAVNPAGPPVGLVASSSADLARAPVLSAASAIATMPSGPSTAQLAAPSQSLAFSAGGGGGGVGDFTDEAESRSVPRASVPAPAGPAADVPTPGPAFPSATLTDALLGVAHLAREDGTLLPGEEPLAYLSRLVAGLAAAALVVGLLFGLSDFRTDRPQELDANKYKKLWF